MHKLFEVIGLNSRDRLKTTWKAHFQFLSGLE